MEKYINAYGNVTFCISVFHQHAGRLIGISLMFIFIENEIEEFMYVTVTVG